MIAEAQVTAEQYDAIFQRERLVQYPSVDAFEKRMGHALERWLLEDAARVLACPYKKHHPNWQHGRVLFSLAMDLLSKQHDAYLLDIGTAKGFSALCMYLACHHPLSKSGQVWSCDVIDPDARVARNTVAEVEGFKTLHEILAPFPEAKAIHFVHSTGADLIKTQPRWHMAYVDGKHTYEAVSYESKLLAERQESGDVMVFDDLQIPGVDRAVKELKGYDIERLWVLKARGYAIARKR